MQQPGNDQNGHGGVGHHMNDGSPHVVVAVMRAMGGFVIVLFELQFAFMLLAFLHQADFCKEGMRFRNFVARLQKSIPVFERE